MCDHHRRRELPGRKDKDSVQSRRGSMNSVTKLTGLFETQAKDGRPEAMLMHNGRLANGKMLIKADQHLDLTALPTPESTPIAAAARKPSRGSREWERNQNLINACSKTCLLWALRSSRWICLYGRLRVISQAWWCCLPQHQHEYVEQLELADDQVSTLEYKSHRSPESAPPRVPQREASLGPMVPQMGKRLEMHSSVYGRGYPMSTGLKNNTTPTHPTHPT